MPSTVDFSGLSQIKFDKQIDGSIQDFTIKVAEEALTRAVANGFDNEPEVITDNVANRDWHEVKPYGKIEWVQKNSLQEVARWIMGELERKSPVLTGRYQRSHIFLINGERVEDEALDELKRGDKLQIANFQPYAGKIEGRDSWTRWEIGTKKFGHMNTRRNVRLKVQGWSRKQIQGQSAQAKNGVYRVVLTEAIARYGRSVVITFAPEQLNLGVMVWGQEGGPRSKFRHKARKRIKVAQVYPCFTLQSKQLHS